MSLPLQNLTMKYNLLILTILTVSISFQTHAEGNHNHFNPKLESLGNDIIGLTVCYRNELLSNNDQETAFENLIAHSDVTGEELGMYYMDSLGEKTEKIMADAKSRQLWSRAYCSELISDYLDLEKLKMRTGHNIDSHGHEDATSEVFQQDIERGRLLSIN